MTVPLRAAALEVDIRIGDVEGNLERIRTALERGAASGAGRPRGAVVVATSMPMPSANVEAISK